MSDLKYTKKLVKKAQHLMNLGEYDRALQLLLLALNATRDVDELTEAAYLLPRINHRLAQAYAHTGDRKAARARFIRAERLFDRDNVIGRAITLRDLGWTLWQWGEFTEGNRQIARAQRLLKRRATTDERHRVELVVTDGLMARTYAAVDKPRAVDQFRQVDEMVRGGNKWIYELDNLRQLIPLVPPAERIVYRFRADKITLRMIVEDEFSLVLDELLDGRIISAASGSTLRNVRRILPF